MNERHGIGVTRFHDEHIHQIARGQVKVFVDFFRDHQHRFKVHRLELTSQKWQGILWKHNLIVYEPTTLVHKDHMLIFVNGGYRTASMHGLGAAAE